MSALLQPAKLRCPDLFKNLLALIIQSLVDGGHALRADDARDGSSDALHGVLEGFLLTAAWQPLVSDPQSAPKMPWLLVSQRIGCMQLWESREITGPGIAEDQDGVGELCLCLRCMCRSPGWTGGLHLMPCLQKRVNRPSTMPCTAPSRMQRSP